MAQITIEIVNFPWTKLIFLSLCYFNRALHRRLPYRAERRGLAVGASVGTMAGSVTGGAAGYQAYAKREQRLGVLGFSGGEFPGKKGEIHQQSMEISP